MLKELLDIIQSNNTAVAKALAFLEIDARENNAINGQEGIQSLAGREIEFGYNGMKRYFLVVNMSAILMFSIILFE